MSDFHVPILCFPNETFAVAVAVEAEPGEDGKAEVGRQKAEVTATTLSSTATVGELPPSDFRFPTSV